MLWKIIAVIIVGFFVYLLFFKRRRENEKLIEKNKDVSDEMVQCSCCKVFASNKESILSNGKWYCSKECLLEK